MPEVVIADTSCLILLHKIEALPLLQDTYKNITITPEVLSEFVHTLPDWILVKSVKDKQLRKMLEQNLDVGEASSIALALELSDCILILDDKKGRRVAKSLNLKFTGSLGVLAKAKLNGHVASVKPFLAKMKATDFRISDALIAKILEIAGEK